MMSGCIASGYVSMPLEAIQPGATAFTRTGAHSAAAVSVKLSMPARAARAIVSRWALRPAAPAKLPVVAVGQTTEHCPHCMQGLLARPLSMKVATLVLEPLPENRPASAELIMNRLLTVSQGVHIGEARKKQAMGAAPAMEEIFAILDIIRESDQGALYLLRHKEKDRLLVARTFRNMSRGVQAARMLMNLRHEGIVAVQGVAGNSSGHIVVMEYLAGGSLADRMVMPLHMREALRILRSVVQALQFAHANRITHGNLTPSNVLFTDTDAVKTGDFAMNDSGDDAEKELGLRIQEDVLACGALAWIAPVS